MTHVTAVNITDDAEAIAAVIIKRFSPTEAEINDTMNELVPIMLGAMDKVVEAILAELDYKVTGKGVNGLGRDYVNKAPLQKGDD